MPQPNPAYSLLAVFSATSAADDTRRTLTEHGCRLDERTAADGYSRQWTVSCAGETALKYAEALLHQGLGLSLRSCRDRVLDLHRDGKLRTKPTQQIRSVTDLTMAYTPGAVRIARLLHDEPARAAELTTKGNTVAVISDGTAVPGYGNLGALPVLEGKAMIYTSLSDLNAVPLVLDTKSVERFVDTVSAIEGLIPAAFHNTAQYANNRVECDHGRLKARLRPMRGLKRDHSARVIMRGHALMQNIRRDHYELGVDARQHRKIEAAVTELAGTI